MDTEHSEDLVQNQSATKDFSLETAGAEGVTPKAFVHAVRDKNSSTNPKSAQNSFSVLSDVLQDIENLPPRSRKPTQEVMENRKQVVKKKGSIGMSSSSSQPI